MRDLIGAISVNGYAEIRKCLFNGVVGSIRQRHLAGGGEGGGGEGNGVGERGVVVGGRGAE